MTTKWVRRRRVRVVRRIIFVIALAVFCVSAYHLLSIYLEYKRGTDEYNSLAGGAKKILESVEEDGTGGSAGIAGAAATDKTSPKAKALCQAMRSENKDYVGWITIENTKVDYPIVQCSDNDYYLTHTFEGERNAAGTLFVDCNLAEGMESKNVIIYGHNMKNGSMFAGLKKYRDDEFYRTHKTFQVYTADRICEYEIFAVSVVEPDSDIYTIGFANNDDFMSYINKVQQQSIMETGVTVSPEDSIITLSTCVNNNVDRLIVQARCLDN